MRCKATFLMMTAQTASYTILFQSPESAESWGVCGSAAGKGCGPAECTPWGTVFQTPHYSLDAHLLHVKSCPLLCLWLANPKPTLNQWRQRVLATNRQSRKIWWGGGNNAFFEQFCFTWKFQMKLLNLSKDIFGINIFLTANQFHKKKKKKSC